MHGDRMSENPNNLGSGTRSRRGFRVGGHSADTGNQSKNINRPSDNTRSKKRSWDEYNAKPGDSTRSQVDMRGDTSYRIKPLVSNDLSPNALRAIEHFEKNISVFKENSQGYEQDCMNLGKKYHDHVQNLRNFKECFKPYLQSFDQYKNRKEAAEEIKNLRESIAQLDLEIRYKRFLLIDAEIHGDSVINELDRFINISMRNDSDELEYDERVSQSNTRILMRRCIVGIRRGRRQMNDNIEELKMAIQKEVESSKGLMRDFKLNDNDGDNRRNINADQIKLKMQRTKLVKGFVSLASEGKLLEKEEKGSLQGIPNACG